MAPSLVLAVAIAVLAPAGPETPLAIANRITKEYANAVRTKDSAWFEKHMDATYVYTTRKGEKRSRSQTMGQMKNVFTMASFERVDAKVVSARRTEGGVLLVMDTTVAAGIHAPDGRKAKLESMSREESLWIPKGTIWVAKRVKELKDETKIDGKLIPG